MLVQMLLALLVCLVANWFDFRTMKIPNRLVLCAAIAGGLLQGVCFGVPGIGQWFLGLLPALILLPFFGLHMIGAGDIKLLSALGGILGMRMGAFLLVLSFLTSGIFGILVLIKRGVFLARFRVLGRYLKACFMTRTILPYGEQSAQESSGKFAFSYGITIGLVCMLWVYYFN